jgi:Na+-translocating ferredoxin:NAD+ oxidoreductase RNF subunit RnfB
MEERRKRRIKEVYSVLPHLNCGFCGYRNCGHYARMVAEGNAPPNLCIGGPYLAWRIERILGIDKLEEIRQEEMVLLRRLEDLRGRLEGLARRL